MPEQDLIVRHHEVYPGAWVNLTGLLRTFMSYEIRAKKELEFMWFAHPGYRCGKASPQNHGTGLRVVSF